MTSKTKLINILINSLQTEPEKWMFDNYTAAHKDWGIAIWIANIPVLNLNIYRPVEINLNLYQKIKLYKAIRRCKVVSTLIKISDSENIKKE